MAGVLYLVKNMELDSGFTKANQLFKLTKIPLRTIYAVLKRIKSKGGMERKPRSGARPKLQGNDRRRVAGIVLKHRKYSGKKIAIEAQKEGQP